MEAVTGLNWRCYMTLFTKTNDSSLPSHRPIFFLLFCNCVSFVDVSIAYVRKLTLLYAGGYSDSLLPPEAAGGLAQKWHRQLAH